MFFLQVLINGLSLGATYGVVTLGLTLIFGVMRVLNFAHGALIMLGGYCIYFSTSGFLEAHFAVGLTLAFCLPGTFGALYEKVLLRPFRGDILVCLIITLALSKILQGSAQAAFGLMHKSLPPLFGTTIHFSGLYFSIDRLFAFVLGLFILVFSIALIDYTKVGTAIRAVSIDNEAASLQGINVGRLFSFGMFISCGLAGFAGALLSLTNPIEAYMGDAPLITCFIVMIIGGLGSIKGALLAAIFIGILESFITSYFGSLIAGIVNFSILIVFLLIRPKGISGE
jgi:branched-chain amino acid transport system permease protein